MSGYILIRFKKTQSFNKLKKGDFSCKTLGRNTFHPGIVALPRNPFVFERRKGQEFGHEEPKRVAGNPGSEGNHRTRK
jgi:hypothetical protein